MKQILRILGSWYSLLLFLVGWEGLARSGLLPPLFLSPPTLVARRFVQLLISGTLPYHIGQSMFRASVGLAISILVGIGLGLLMARSEPVRSFFEPIISVGFPAPKIALFPTFIVLAGLGHLPKIIIVFLACLFPMVITTFNGARAVERSCIWSALSMGSSPRQLFWKVILPASLPYIFSGLRIAVFVSLIGVVVAEMVASGEGLGHFLIYSERTLEAVDMFVALVTIALIGVLLDNLVLLARRTLLHWAEELEMAF